MRCAALFPLLALPVAAIADPATIEGAEAMPGDDTWTVSVTLRHTDTGWEDYADGWDVLLADGTVLKPDPDSPFTRLLLHPHVEEQPFTRSQSNIAIPSDVNTVTVRAHDIVDGWGGQEITVDLTQSSGEGYTVE